MAIADPQICVSTRSQRSAEHTIHLKLPKREGLNRRGMKHERTINYEIAKFGFADGSPFVSSEETPQDSFDREDFYERYLYSFSPREQFMNKIRSVAHSFDADVWSLESTQVHTDASLLGLPTELRLQILRHLLPDVDEIKKRDLKRRVRPTAAIRHLRDARIGIWHRVSKSKREEKLSAWEATIEYEYSALRKDLEPCFPTIMRANRQLYAEAAQIVYGGRTFTAQLLLNEFQFLSRGFQVGFSAGDFGMLESQLRHISDLEITIDADTGFCPLTASSSHSCARSGCARKRVDGIKNTAEFLSGCVGLSCLKIDIVCSEYIIASARRPPAAKELRRLENKMLQLVRPFSRIRGLAWSNISIMQRPSRNWPNSGAKLHSEIEAMEKQMRLDEEPPARTDFALTKCAFHSIFTINTEYRNVMKQEFGIDIQELEQKCWQACDDGNKNAVLKARKDVVNAWEEHKRIVEGFLEQIGDMALEPQSKKKPQVAASRKSRAKAESGQA